VEDVKTTEDVNKVLLDLGPVIVWMDLKEINVIQRKILAMVLTVEPMEYVTEVNVNVELDGLVTDARKRMVPVLIDSTVQTLDNVYRESVNVMLDIMVTSAHRIYAMTLIVEKTDNVQWRVTVIVIKDGPVTDARKRKRIPATISTVETMESVTEVNAIVKLGGLVTDVRTKIARMAARISTVETMENV